MDTMDHLASPETMTPTLLESDTTDPVLRTGPLLTALFSLLGSLAITLVTSMLGSLGQLVLLVVGKVALLLLLRNSALPILDFLDPQPLASQPVLQIEVQDECWLFGDNLT